MHNPFDLSVFLLYSIWTRKASADIFQKYLNLSFIAIDYCLCTGTPTHQQTQPQCAGFTPEATRGWLSNFWNLNASLCGDSDRDENSNWRLKWSTSLAHRGITCSWALSRVVLQVGRASAFYCASPTLAELTFSHFLRARHWIPLLKVVICIESNCPL